MLTEKRPEITGAIVARNSLKEAAELLRLIDEGRLDELQERLAASRRAARRRAVLEVLGAGTEEEADEKVTAAL